MRVIIIVIDFGTIILSPICFFSKYAEGELKDCNQQINYIAKSFWQEMENQALGGRLYSETLATQLAINLLRDYCTFPVR